MSKFVGFWKKEKEKNGRGKPSIEIPWSRTRLFSFASIDRWECSIWPCLRTIVWYGRTFSSRVFPNKFHRGRTTEFSLVFDWNGMTRKEQTTLDFQGFRLNRILILSISHPLINKHYHRLSSKEIKSIKSAWSIRNSRASSSP